MTAVPRLADPGHCPSCHGALPPSPRSCPACRLPLTGPVAARLWQVSVQADQLLGTRADLIDELRRAAAGPAAPAVPTALDAHPMASLPPVAPVPPRAPAPEWSRRRVQNLLLALGAGLLAVAAVIFVAVSWDRLGVGGRSAVMAGVTAVAGLAAHQTFRRGLAATAEALSLLTVGLAVLDCYGARSADLAGLADSDALLFWAGALTTVTVLTALFATVLPVRALPVAAALLGQLPVPLVTAHLADHAGRALAVVAAGLTAQAVATLALALGWPLGARTTGARAVVAVGGMVALALAALTAGVAAYAEDGSLVAGTALLLVQAGVLAVAGTQLPVRRPAETALLPVVDGLAAVLLVAAVWAPAYDGVPSRWLPAALAALGSALLAAAGILPTARRTAPGVVALAAAALPALAAVDTLARALEEMLRPLEQPWTQTADQARTVGDGPAVAVLLVAGLALALAAGVLRLPDLRTAAVPVVAAALTLTAPALGADFAGALGVQIGLAGALLVVGALLDARGWVRPGSAALGSGAVLLLLAVTWSLAVDAATVAGLPAAAAAALAGAAASRGNDALRPWRACLVTSALLLAVAETGAVARYVGAGWPAVWSLTLAALTVAGLATALGISARTSVADGFWAPLHTAAVVVGAAAALAAAGAVAAWQGVTVAGCGLAVATAAGALLGATAAPVPAKLATTRPVRGALQVVAGVAAASALVLAGDDGDVLWLALLVVGVGLGLVATTPERHRLGWLAGLVLAASSWVRLALADVDAPEAYTVPAAVALLVVGALRRRQDPAYSSWKAYGAGLSLALAPSLVRAVTDAGNLRPLLLAVVAAVVVGAGVARRLQAPLLVGGAVLTVDALVQLAPYLAAAYDVVPRWLTIGLLGLALLGAGATYEKRVQQLRRVGRRVAELG